MLKAILSISQAFEPKENTATLKMVSHDRMAGSVPVWEKNLSAKEQTSARFEEVLTQSADTQTASPYQLSLTHHNNADVEAPTEKPFGFGDLIDIINPLHHIPVVNSLYRQFSGDTIRGPGQILGGALFGGPFGAASSMINILIEHDTGNDLTGHAMNMMSGKNERPAPPPNERATNAYLKLSENNDIDQTYNRTA